jgi:3-hydroxyisobutyrate dehydrogenase-like beta-hydroxyacid dehydrogenase
LLAKDSRLAMEAAGGVGYSPEMGAIAQEHFAQALAAGLEADDDSAMWAFVQSLVDAKGTQP